MSNQKLAMGDEEDPPLSGRLLTVHNETVKLEANHLDRFASSIQTTLMLGGGIKALSKDAGVYDMILAASLFVAGFITARVLHQRAKHKMGELKCRFTTS